MLSEVARRFRRSHSKSTCVLIDDGPAVRQQRCFFGSKAAARHEPAISLAIVDILKGGSEAEPKAARQIGQRVFEGVRAGPAHLSEERRQTRRAARAD